jgi:hypothetical protein
MEVGDDTISALRYANAVDRKRDEEGCEDKSEPEEDEGAKDGAGIVEDGFNPEEEEVGGGKCAEDLHGCGGDENVVAIW